MRRHTAMAGAGALPFPPSLIPPGWLALLSVAVRRLGALLARSGTDAREELDATTLDRARQGDHLAFAEIVRRHDPRLRALAFRLMGDRQRTDDVLQESYVRAFRSLERFRGDASVGTWLYRITYNTCIDELRRRRPVSALPTEQEREDWRHAAPDPSDAAVERADLATALAALPPHERAAVMLVDADGLGYTEASRILGIPQGTLASRLNRARAALRFALEAS